LFELEVMTDGWSSETSWELLNSDGEVIQSVEEGELTDKFMHQYTFCLPADCYDFTIFDGDGICCRSGNGYYKGNIYGRSEIFDGGKFFDQETKSFCGLDLCS